MRSRRGGLRTLTCQWFQRQLASLNVLDTVTNVEPLDSDKRASVVNEVDIVNLLSSSSVVIKLVGRARVWGHE